MPSAAFLKFWRTDLTRENLLSHTSKEDSASLRLVCHDFSVKVAPQLFSDIHIPFNANTFTRLARTAALDRIGYYVKTCTFHMPHTPDTFLPPLLDPITGQEQSFLYEPSLTKSRPPSSSSNASGPKYGSWEMNDLLVKQYPPIFHAATNIPSFIRAFNAMPFLRHLRISCPGQPSGQLYRRDAVDYALISLRIALERAVVPELDTLSLQPIHPGAVLYLRPQLSIGSTPASIRRWRAIKNLHIEMDGFAFGPSHANDHLKLLHSYLRSFPSLHRLTFRWLGTKGPSPISLATEPCIAAPSALHRSSACSVSSAKPPFQPLRLRRLEHLVIENAIVDASQISTFIMSHRKVLHEFKFEDCQLRSGDWDAALAPLSKIVGHDRWKQKQEEVMDVPIVLKQTPVVEECIPGGLWDDTRKHSRGFNALKRASARTRGMLGAGEEGLKKLLRASTLAWR